jgi:hypothetical protein
MAVAPVIKGTQAQVNWQSAESKVAVKLNCGYQTGTECEFLATLAVKSKRNKQSHKSTAFELIGNLAGTKKNKSYAPGLSRFVYTRKLTILPRNIFSIGRRCLHKKNFKIYHCKDYDNGKTQQEHRMFIYFHSYTCGTKYREKRGHWQQAVSNRDLTIKQARARNNKI